MTSNHKLTSLIQGRTIVGTQSAGTNLTLRFDDGSAMTVQTAPSNASIQATGGKIAKVRQGGTELALDMVDGSTLTLTTAEETSSVMVRDKNHALEYAD